jgi:hypothetical protein
MLIDDPVLLLLLLICKIGGDGAVAFDDIFS